MHEIAPHWRLRKNRLGLTGFSKKTPEGKMELSLTGANWVEARTNGHHKDEDPLVGAVIYQAPEEPIAIDLHREVEIPSETE